MQRADLDDCQLRPRVQEGLPVPALPPHAARLEIDAHLVLRAILIAPSSDLSLGMWNSVVEEMERHVSIENESLS